MASMILDPPCTEDSKFLSFDVTGIYLIPLCSWRGVQHPHAIRSRIGLSVVEESAIELSDRRHTLQHCNLKNTGRGGCILYRCVAVVEPNHLPQSDPESVKRLWRDLPSSSEFSCLVTG